MHRSRNFVIGIVSRTKRYQQLGSFNPGRIQDFRIGDAGVGHVGLHAGDAVESGARAHAAGRGFVVGEGLASAWVEAADGEVARERVPQVVPAEEPELGAPSGSFLRFRHS